MFSQVVDLMAGQEIPDDVLEALTDPDVTKWAYNAVFERVCLSEYLRHCKRDYFKGYGDDATKKYISPKGWKCTMTWAAYMGLPLSLRNVGLALKLDEKKMEEGKDLIRYFCMPCSPTKSNGGRTRNLPAHAQDKWKVFKAYRKDHDGMVKVFFDITDEHLMRVPAGLIDINYHVDFGTLRGYLCKPDGTKIVLDGMTGIGEDKSLRF